MTVRLYYQDPYLQEFQAKVTRRGTDESGRDYVVLDQTAFYPEGGGQPSDHGEIEGISVLDVQETEGEIRHYLSFALPAHMDVVTGRINWMRRLDHMQQHTGQHLLSAAFDELFSATTVGFHLGREVVTIDLLVPELSEEQAQQAEELANRIVLENRPITARFVNEEELARLQLHKAPAVTENIRLVIVEDFDYNPCGGTHPARTGEVGPIKVLRWERHKGNVRLEFLCGYRALHLFRERFRHVQQTSRLIGCPEGEVPEQVQRLLAVRSELEREIQALRSERTIREAAEFLREAERVKDVVVVIRQPEGRTLPQLQQLAQEIMKREANSLVLLASSINGKWQAVFARGEGISIPMNDVLRQVMTVFGGKGGGKPKLAQGGGETDAQPSLIVQSAWEVCRSYLM